MTQKALSLSVLQILAISCELRFSYICNVICLLAIQPFPLISSINVENRGVWGLWSNSEIPDSCHLLRSLRLEAVIPPQATKSWLLPDKRPAIRSGDGWVSALPAGGLWGDGHRGQPRVLKSFTPVRTYIQGIRPLLAHVQRYQRAAKEDFCHHYSIKATQPTSLKTQSLTYCVKVSVHGSLPR